MSEQKKTLTLDKKRLGGTLSIASSGVKKNVLSDNKVVVVKNAPNKPSVRGGSKVNAAPDASSGLTDDERNKRIAAVRMAEIQRRKQEEERRRFAQQEEERKREEQAAAASVDIPSLDEPKEDVKNSKPQVSSSTVNLDDLLRRDKIKNLNLLFPSPKKNVESSNVTQQAVVDSGANNVVSLSHDVQKPAINTKNKKVVEFEDDRSAVKKDAMDKRSLKKISVNQLSVMLDEDGGGTRRRSLASINRAKSKHFRKNIQTNVEKIARDVLVPDCITVGELANRMAEKAADVIKRLMNLGMMATINQVIDSDTAELLVSEFGHRLKRVTEAEIEAELMQRSVDSPQNLMPRAPVVTIMGHVDHGKTSLLDALRNTDVAAGEAGGITQHIGAYQVSLSNSKVISFLDTPGHEAFTAMRMRGAKVTDIVVLVVAADDGIMQQTVEAISHAKAAGVSIIVAINKIDKPDANPERVKMELLQHNIIPESMGGDVIIVEVSAKQKIGLEKLEEMILLQADMLELMANPNRSAEGAVIEARVDKGKGVIATFLVQNGTLKSGDIVVAGLTWGKVRALINDKGRVIEEANPSMPVEVWGLESAPVAGDEFLVVPNEKTARDIVSLRQERDKKLKFAANKPKSLDMMLKKALDKGIKELPVVIKCDVQGSVEAVSGSLHKLATDEISVRVLHQAVGGITESDVTLATASDAIILGFNVRANAQAREMARINGVEVKYYSVIYNLVDDIKAAMGGMLSPLRKESVIGYVEIRDVFDLSKSGKVAGCYVTEGVIKRAANARIIRDNIVIYDGKLKALRRFKDDVKEVTVNFECGLSFENYEDIKVGDRIEVYEVTEQARVL